MARKKIETRKSSSKPEAVIEIASTGVRLSIVEVISKESADENSKGETGNAQSVVWNTLDRSTTPITFGAEFFATGQISQSSISQCIQILARYKEQLASWGLTPQDTTVIATSALRESPDRDSIIDRIFVRTGFSVRIIDGLEESRLMYIAVRECFKNSPINLADDDFIILEAGGGSTEITLLKKGSIVGAHSFRLGAARVEQRLGQVGATDTTQRYVRQFILNSKNSLNQELKNLKVKSFIAVGKIPQIAALYVGKPISTFLWEIPREKFFEFAGEIKNYSVEECMARFKISYNDATQMNTGFFIYETFFELNDAKTIIVPETNLREGILISKIDSPDEELQQEFYKQISAGALNLLRKYHGDESHASYVAKTSLAIFDALKDESALDKHARVLLEAAAMLHDIGIFVRMGNHHLHSAYIISNSEFFGLGKDEITIISEIAKYHRDNAAPQDDEQFQKLPRAERMMILKLTSIVRIADALDRGHTQKFEQLKFRKQGDSFIIDTGNRHNTVLERRALSEKGEMFESVFGYKVILT